MMKFGPIAFIDKLNRTFVFRSTQPSEAAVIVDYMNDTAGETRFLSREPGEFAYTAAQEASYTAEIEESPCSLMLTITVDGEFAGTAARLYEVHRRKLCGCAVDDEKTVRE